MTKDTTIQPPFTSDDKRSTTQLETSEFAIDQMTISIQMVGRAWKRSRKSLRYPVSCSEYHPYLNPNPSIGPDRDIEITNAAAADTVSTKTHSKRRRPEKSQSQISKKSQSQRAKLAKNQSTDVQTKQPASKASKGSKRLKSSQPSISKRRRTSKELRRIPGYDDFFDYESDSGLMDIFETLGGETMADTYGHHVASRMDPAAWDYNFF